jgi:arylsulfatase
MLGSVAAVATAASAWALGAHGARGGPDPATGSEGFEPSRVLPRPERPSDARVGLTVTDSKPGHMRRASAPAGAPNVLIVLLDDVGFGQAGTFGGPVPTPTLDRLAKTGLRYNQFHTTALCSPTRAAILSGRNHHEVHTGTIMETATPFDGYDGRWPKSAVCVAETLKQNGYRTAAFGKWHNTPEDECGPTGPFDRWPTNQGFERFYGFLGGETDQFHPTLVQDVTPVEPPATPEEGYHLTQDLADRAIDWMRVQHTLAPSQPFFLYFAPGACHAPHQAPREWIDRFEGQFDQGWDRLREETFERQKKLGVIPADAKLTPRPAEIPAWDSFPADQRRLFSRMMEVFAGFLAHTDHEIGRVVQAIDDLGALDDTLVLYVVGDNGASAEGTPVGTLNEIKILNGLGEDVKNNLAHMSELGTPLHHNHYPVGWAWAGDTPFQWTKQVASHFGGTRNPLVVSWPRRIKDAGGLRTQFHHVIDVVPTIFEAAGIPAPSMVNGVPQVPIEGASMVYTWDDAAARSRRRTQYFEMFGNRGIYHEGWVACARHAVPWLLAEATSDFSHDRWELYRVSEDFSEADDLAAREPGRLRELQDLFWAEAAKHNVLPLDGRLTTRVGAMRSASPLASAKSLTFLPGTRRVPEICLPSDKGRSLRVTVTAEVPPAGAEGMLVTLGAQTGGWGLMIQDRKLVYIYNYFGDARTTITSRDEVPAGRVALGYEFLADSARRGTGGLARLLVNGRVVGEKRIERTVPYLYGLGATLDVGEDTGTPVDTTYRVPFRFTGKIERVHFDYGDAGATLPQVGMSR